jgi:hypothetical protein
MGNKEFHLMLGMLIDTPGEDLVEEISDEELVKRKAIEEGISLEEKDVADLSKVLEEIREMKREGKKKLCSPRN